MQELPIHDTDTLSAKMLSEKNGASGLAQLRIAINLQFILKKCSICKA